MINTRNRVFGTPVKRVEQLGDVAEAGGGGPTMNIYQHRQENVVRLT